MDKSEQYLFGCQPWAGEKPTWEEAGDRMIYIAHNIRQLDTGSAPNFGDITFIMNTGRLDDTVIITPVDSGVYEANCNSSSLCSEDVTHGEGRKIEVCVPGPKAYRCPAYPVSDAVAGTLQHMDHLILPNLEFFMPEKDSNSKSKLRENIQKLFRRSAFAGDYTQLPKTNIDEAQMYWESNILANPRFKGDVKFVVASFGSLFGTEGGRSLQKLADYYAWPLVWSLGSGAPELLDTSTEPFAGNKRVLDPTNVHTNATLPAGARSHFEAIWSKVGVARANGLYNSVFADLWAALEAEQVRVAPITALACAAPHDCIGTAIRSGDCVCLSGASASDLASVDDANLPQAPIVPTACLLVGVVVSFALAASLAFGRRPFARPFSLQTPLLAGA
jgi:hypothetical protein